MEVASSTNQGTLGAPHSVRMVVASIYLNRESKWEDLELVGF